MKYKFQVADVNLAERPEYEDTKNPEWETVLEANTALDILCQISDYINDEEDFSHVWTRIIIDNVCVQSGLKI